MRFLRWGLLKLGEKIIDQCRIDGMDSGCGLLGFGDPKLAILFDQVRVTDADVGIVVVE